MNDYSDLIKVALKNKNISASAASRKACGNSSFIRNIFNGHVPRLDSFKKLCDVLDLEFYVGFPNEKNSRIDEDRLYEAIETCEEGLLKAEKYLSPEKKARMVVVIYLLLDNIKDVGFIRPKVVHLISAVA